MEEQCFSPFSHYAIFSARDTRLVLNKIWTTWPILMKFWNKNLRRKDIGEELLSILLLVLLLVLTIKVLLSVMTLRGDVSISLSVSIDEWGVDEVTSFATTDRMQGNSGRLERQNVHQTILNTQRGIVNVRDSGVVQQVFDIFCFSSESSARAKLWFELIRTVTGKPLPTLPLTLTGVPNPSLTLNQ